MGVGMATLAAGLASSAAGVYNNQQNIKFQSEANDTQIKLANTAHQREVRDLIAAGLNPVLSAQGSGASVPQLGTPSLENPSRGLADAVNTAIRMDKLDIPLKESQTLVNSAQAHNLMAQGKLYDAQAEAVKSAKDIVDDSSDIATRFGGWLGEKWASLFGEKEPVPQLSQRMIDKVLMMSLEDQDAYFKRLHKLRKERGIR